MSETLTSADEAQLSQTIEMFEVITQSQSNDYQSLEILKEAYSKLGREKDVINTSKRIAQAYVQLGQLSSAILEYETVLQRYPDDKDVQLALKEIEAKANNFSPPQQNGHANGHANGDTPHTNGRATNGAAQTPRQPTRSSLAMDLDDGRTAMQKIFVDSKLVSPADFEMCWRTPDPVASPPDVIEPFIQVLADKGIVISDKSLKLLVDKTRLAYLPMERYDVDLELTRSFSADICRRWCILPFDRMSKTLLVATANPFNRVVTKELVSDKHTRVLYYLASPTEIITNLKKIFR